MPQPASVEEIEITMKRITALSALGVMASALCAQGLNPPANQTKEDWEEINFEFNSSILSDGYPSLLRLADLLNQHRDYKVAVTGHTDYVGSNSYNDKLALARANTVKQFLVKYGAGADQLTVAGDGKRQPEVDNKSKEGRFMNRRVTLRITDGTGKLVKEGGISEVLPAWQSWLDQFAKKQQECCDAILKRLDKLDDILAAVKALEGENAALKGQLADQGNQINTLRDRLDSMPKPLTEPQTAEVVHKEAVNAVDEARKHNQKFSLLGINVGPTYGSSARGNATFDANGRFFSPFGGDGTHAVQAQGEYIYNSQAQEGQFDLGLVNRWGNVQAGVFSSFKYLNYKQYQNGGALGQGAFLLDYIFSRGRIGVFGTQGFKNYAVVNNATLAPGVFLQTYAKVVNQYGADALVGVWGNAYLQGNLGLLRRQVTGGNTVGGEVKLTQPVSTRVAFTAALDYNQTGIASTGNGQVMFGLEMGSYIHPKDYGSVKTPVPMDVPRIRYEFGTRRVGTSPPIANAGPSQLGVPAGTITLNGSGSYDPLGEALTYAWSEISGPAVMINNPTQAVATFTAAAGQSYTFLLKVTNTDGISAQATTLVTTAAANTQIVQFTAQPAAISAGQSSTLSWVIKNATSASISPGVGAINATTGSISVSPTATTSYTLTATGPNGTSSQSLQITVGTANVQIVRFVANPRTIAAGAQSTLSWTTSGASTISISPGIGTVTANGSTTVTPATTTTYTLTATGSDGTTVTAPVTVTVTGSAIPQIVTFVATPQSISPGQSTKICWQVNGSTNISIAPGVGNNLNANDCATVTPSTTTTYTLTATNAVGQVQGNLTVNVGLVQILSFQANPVSSEVAGAPVTLSWTTANATSVVLTGADIPPMTLPVNGSYTDNPVTNETYTLTAYGPGGQTVSVTISVFVR
jgi:outer membrane protein OmpA-like peptidoglycan-associated protein